MRKNRIFKSIASVALTLAMAVTSFGLNPLTAYAGAATTIAETKVFGYTGGVQTFTASTTGKYTIELAGAAGGNAGHYSGQNLIYVGGKGGKIKFTMDLTAGQTLYLYVGQSGKCDGDSGYTPTNSNGTDSYGGAATGSREATGGGATEIRLDGTSRSNILAVAGGGGGASQAVQGQGINGLDAAIASAGNNGNTNGTGSSASGRGAGGGGGYIGGSAGSTTSPAHGGSNYVASSIKSSLNYNGTNDRRTDGYVEITRLSSYQLTVDPNGGVWNGSDKLSTHTLDTTYQSTQTFGFNGGRGKGSAGINGSTQTYTVPYTGYYYIEACGASGGSDATSGGRGGYVKSYTYLIKGQTLYINVGGHGGDCVPMSETAWGNSDGWNGGAIPGNGSGGYSGGGGGATSIAISNHGVLKNYASYKNDVLVVAGGGSGGSAASAGEGGTVLYAGTGTNNHVVNGASTARLANTATTLVNDWSYFGQGQNPGTNVDGGGGAGGWVGGRRGLDAAGNSSGGGASFVNTSNNSICVGLTPNYQSGDGWARISYVNDMVVLPNPTREGYTFAGWQKISGNGAIQTTVDGQTAFTYAEGLTQLKATWTKNASYGTLTINPNGGYYADTLDNTVVNKVQGTTFALQTPYRYGYVFTGWTLSGEGSLSGNNYVFTAGSGTVTAQWSKSVTTLNVNPNGGVYNGTSEVTTYPNKQYGAVEKIVDPTRVGYDFNYWEETSGSDGWLDKDGWHYGTTNGTLTASWTARNDTKYIVNHYQMNLDGATYTLKDTDNKKGTSDSTLTIDSFKKNYEGFTYAGGFASTESIDVPQAYMTTTTLNADGSLVINMFYTRNQYTVTLKDGQSDDCVTDDGITALNGAGTYYYNQDVTISVDMIHDYSFVSWTGDYNSDKQTYTFKMPAKNVTETALVYITNGVEVGRYDLNSGDAGTSRYVTMLDSEGNENQAVFSKAGNGGYVDRTDASIDFAHTCKYLKGVMNGKSVDYSVIPSVDDTTYGKLYSAANASGSTIIASLHSETPDIVFGSMELVETLQDSDVSTKHGNGSTTIEYVNAIKFDGNGAEVIKDYDTFIDIDRTDYTLEAVSDHYTNGTKQFMYWSDKADGSGVHIKDMATLSFEEIRDLNTKQIPTLYAIWGDSVTIFNTND